MKVKVLKNFYDTTADLKLREKGKTFEIGNETRVKVLTEKGYVEAIKEETTETTDTKADK